MLLEFQREYKSIRGSICDTEIPNLVVLSGPNGSGKTQLLEAISVEALRLGGLDASRPVRLFTLGQLVTPASEAAPLSSFEERWASVPEMARNLSRQWERSMSRTSPEMEQAVLNALRSNHTLNDVGIASIQAHPKHILEMTDQDFYETLPLISTAHDPFALSVTQIFATYFLRLEENRFRRWKASEGYSIGSVLSDEEFVGKYGPPPWATLNEALSLMDLPYEFKVLVDQPRSTPYEALLVDPVDQVELSFAALSSGEKTLLTIALCLYSNDHFSGALNLPSLLLLDEADASLHPQMASKLLSVLENVFVKGNGIPVILTTHSPTTVALAPPEALFTIRRVGNPRLRAVGKDEALKTLTVGIPTLSVSMENRRTVFTEDKTDAECYEILTSALDKYLAETPFVAVYVPAGMGSSDNPESTGGRDAVLRLVRELRDSGNQSVFGVVDRDTRASSPPGILYSKTRYSLENLVLDPLLVGCFMLREGHITSDEVDLGPNLRHIDISESNAQQLARAVTNKLNIKHGPLAKVRYCGGITLQLPQHLLDMNGHTLERLYSEHFPPLRQYGKKLKATVLRKAAWDCPGMVPQDLVDLINELAA